jgi:hypothetical protein
MVTPQCDTLMKALKEVVGGTFQRRATFLQGGKELHAMEGLQKHVGDMH